MTDNVPVVASSDDAAPESDVRFERSFAAARDGFMTDHTTDRQTIKDYIFRMGRSDGYKFCGHYPTETGPMIVMKRYRRD